MAVTKKTTSKKTLVPVKDLQEAIKDGMTHDEAAKHALHALKPKLNYLREEDVDMDVDMFTSFLKDLILYMVESKDQSSKFRVEEEYDYDDDDGYWSIVLRDQSCEFEGEVLYYYPTDMDFAEFKANEDVTTLNQFMLDFYGIKRRAEIKPTKKEVRDELKRVKATISEKKSELKSLTAHMEKLLKASRKK